MSALPVGELAPDATGAWQVKAAPGVDGFLSWRKIDGRLYTAPQPSDLALLHPQSALNQNVLERLLTWDFPTSESPFQGVHRIPANSRCRVTPDGEISALEPTWAVSAEPSNADPLPDLWAALVAECATLMQPARRTAIMLSGGLDSSAVAAAAVAAARSLDQPTPLLLSGWYPGLDCDERPWQELVARHLNASHRGVNALEVPLWPMLGDAVRESRHPLVDGQEGINLALYRIARSEGCDLVLMGVGGDELFEGRGLEIDLMRGGRWKSAFDLVSSTLIARPNPRVPALLRRLVRLPIQPTRSGVSREDRDRAGSWCRAMLRRTLNDPGLSWRLEMAKRTGRRAGLAVRFPFLSAGFLTAFGGVRSEQLPAETRVKGLLRQHVAPHLPAAVVDRIDKARFASYYRARLVLDAPAMIDTYRDLRARYGISWLPKELGSVLGGSISSASFLTGWMALSILLTVDEWSTHSPER